MQFQTIRLAFLSVVVLCTSSLEVAAQGRILRKHMMLETAPLKLVPATNKLARGSASIKFSGRYRKITSNGIPTHRVGAFPNAHNPHKVTPQPHKFLVAYIPRPASKPKPLPMGTSMGVALNGRGVDL